MATEFTMPRLGMTMESGKVSEWRKSEGEGVEPGEIVLVVETDKVFFEVESPVGGLLHIDVPEGEEAPVGGLLAVIAADRTEYDRVKAGPPRAAAGPAEAAPAAPSAQVQPVGQAASGAAEGKVRIAPAARKLAEELGLDYRRVSGTGPGGRITREDVEKFAAGRAAGGAAAAAAPVPPEEDRVIVLQRNEHRRIVARKMLEAVREAAQTYHSNDVDATAVAELRNRLLAQVEKETGLRVTITDILMKLTAGAIREHPIMNSSCTDGADILYRNIHMGMAMSLREGELLVPVIRDIDRKTVAEIARIRTDYIDRGRQGKLLPDEIRGSTFTFSALGMFGLERFAAILNRPENAILAVGAILDRPWVHAGQVVVRKVMNTTLTYDHRTIYGAEAARFMATLRRQIEHPEDVLKIS